MCKQPPNLKHLSPSYRKGMDAIEKLVLKECGPDLVLPSVGQEDHVMKRFDLLISCMARKELRLGTKEVKLESEELGLGIEELRLGMEELRMGTEEPRLGTEH